MYIHKEDGAIDGFARLAIPVHSDNLEPCEGWEKLKEEDQEELDTFLKR